MDNNIDDIENQFYIIEEFNDNVELINLIENCNSNKFHKNDFFPENKFKKSKSFPNTIEFLNYKNNNIYIHPINNFENTHDDNLSDSTCLIKDNNKFSIWTNLYNIKKNILYKFAHMDIIEIIGKLLTICLHILIMIIFEIYFYFNYVVWIEKEEFVNQINKYIGKLDYLPINSVQKEIIKYVIKSNENIYINYLDYLYIQYINSLDVQKKILYNLLVKACKMASIVGIIFVGLFIFGLFYRKKIKWNWIWIENFLMFLFLGVFEYFFFVSIIMNFNPITEEEVKYLVASGIVGYFNSTV